eukprot:15431915-Alexandrium_andersonii.AAC.1
MAPLSSPAHSRAGAATSFQLPGVLGPLCRHRLHPRANTKADISRHVLLESLLPCSPADSCSRASTMM